MSVLYIVLPLAILIAIAAVAGFIWMVRGGQLDDLDSPALRILHDDADAPSPSRHEPRPEPDQDPNGVRPDRKAMGGGRASE